MSIDARGPDRELQTRLLRLSSSGVADARGKKGALPGGVRRLHGQGTLAGPVVTAGCGEGSVSAVLATLARASPGDVLVAQGGGEWAYFGELTGAEAVRIGLTGIVVDGLVRDMERLATLDLSVFARGLTPQGARPAGPGETGVLLRMGDVDLREGDWIVGDIDGLTVIPKAELEATVTRAQSIATAETACWERILAGASLLDERSQDGTILREAIR